MTKADPDPQSEKRGRHARSDDGDDDSTATEEPKDEAPAGDEADADEEPDKDEAPPEKPAATGGATRAASATPAPPHQGLPGLLTVRATDAGQLEGYHGYWMAQLAAAQVTTDEQASAYAVRHHDSSAQFPTLLVRGDDTGGADVDDTWWITLVRQSFESKAEVEAWCSRAGLAPPGCTPRMISD